MTLVLVYISIFRGCLRGGEKVNANSDSCDGQNINIKMALFWSHIVSTLPITEINHKFTVSGHSFLPNDQDNVVKQKKIINASHIYVLREWMDLVAGARRKTPFEVVRMTTSDFLNYDGLADHVVNITKHY